MKLRSTPPRSVAAQATGAGSTQRAISAEIRLGMWALLAMIVGLASWAALARVSHAVIAAGTIRPTEQRVTIVAADGGVLRHWQLVEGQAVRAGDVLAVIDDPEVSAQLEALTDAEAGERLRVQRLRRLATWRPGLALGATRSGPQGAGAAAGASPASLAEDEDRLLVGSWAQQQASIDQIDRQRLEAAARVTALQQALAADGAALSLAREELARNEQLASAGFVSNTRLIALRRAAMEAESRQQSQRGVLGEALDRHAELVGRRTSEPLRMARDNARELVDAQRRLAELKVHLAAADHRWQRLTVRAPGDGTVVDLRPLAPGSVVAARQPLLDLLPADPRLRVQAPLRPQDIGSVHVGMSAEVRVTAFSSRDTQPLAARVVLVGADRSTVPQPLLAAAGAVGAPAPGDTPLMMWLELAPHSLPLAAGMDAEVLIAIEPRSPLEYWLSPLSRLLRHAMRER